MLQEEEVIEDWEVWGDPREVARRKADRLRAAQPLPVRQSQVSAPPQLVVLSQPQGIACSDGLGWQSAICLAGQSRMA